MTSGVTYEFKIEARNQYDYSDFSDSITLLAAYIPEIPITVTTKIILDTVKVAWVLPSDNGSPITEFKIFVQDIGTDIFIQESTDC